MEHIALLVDGYIRQIAPDAHTLSTSFELPLAGTLPPSPASRLKAKNNGQGLSQLSSGDALGRALKSLLEHEIKHGGRRKEGKGWIRRMVEAIS
ncbi:hypothetical protein MBH78_11585 [Oceanimonas sp. NS1]|nr:hypothetical protein [Oceanimonas sp. NS1]